MRRVIFRFLCVGITAWLLLPAQLPAQTPALDHPLTLPEALALLRAHNATLAAGRAHLQAVHNQEITAGLRPNPVLNSANEDFSPSHFNPTYFSNQQEFTNNVSELFERGHKRGLRVENARLSSAVAEDTYHDNERQLALQLKLAFTGVLLAKANLELATQNRQDYAETVRLNEIRRQAGDISSTDLDRIRVEAAQFESDLLSAELNLDQARMQLVALLGAATVPPHFDVQGSLTAPELKLTLADLQTQALANRPDYLAALQGVDKAQSDLRLAFANGATDLTFGGEYKRNGPLNTFGFTVSVPLRIFDHNQGEKLRTRNELEASRLTEEAARTQVLSDVDQAWAGYQSALQRSQLYSRNYLQMAQSVREHLEFSYRNSGTTLLDYLDAVRSYRDVQLAANAADAILLTAIHQLSFVAGTEVMP
jgi:cobalt-zinc-cadmium efflux system outer membrane protein